VQSAATFVDKLIAGLREQLPHNSEGRATCPRCKQVIPEEDALCWPCADAARQAEAHADARKAIADGTRALMASLPPWPYADVRNPEWCKRVHPRCLGVAERWTAIRGPLTVLGPSESGKTSALRALAVRLRLDALRAGDVGHPIVGAMWVSALDYAKIRRELRRGFSDFQLDAMQRAPLLFVDELGQEDAAPVWLLELLDERYRHRRPTLATSGLNRAQLEGRYGDGIVRRLEQPGGQIVDLYGGDGG
jgi:hypothetical protein